MKRGKKPIHLFGITALLPRAQLVDAFGARHMVPAVAAGMLLKLMD
jgi:hypothetical protein